MAPIAVKLTRVAWMLAGVLATGALLAPVASAWSPEPATYKVGVQSNDPVKMSDGTILRANVYYPVDPNTGQAATGPFPVILTQTPYGKDNAVFSGLGAGESAYLVERGYINVVADVRGSGGSQGEWGLFDPVQGTDGATLVNWSAALPHADGDVGLLGASYLGIDQFAAAADAGPAHVKAMFPIISGNDLYRDTSNAGGFPDIEFDSFYLGLTAGLNLLLPIVEGNTDVANALTAHIHDLATFDAALTANIETGGDQAYDGSYWAARNPVNQIQKIVDDKIPAFLVGGWFDLFQRGEMLNYSSFQNAYAHRPLLSAMLPSQKATARYQLIQGPWYHVTAGTGLSYHGLNLQGVELAWFDHWLKHVDTGITQTSTPLHLNDLGTGKYVEASRYPLNQATPTTFYLQPGSGLSTTAPAGSTAPDSMIFTGASIPCTRSTEQWAAGLGQLALSFFNISDPCTQNGGLAQIGPGQHSYTTAPFKQATTIAGPIGATLYATSTTKDTEWVVTVSDVAPNGTATPLTSGLLEGNQRALDPTSSWTAPDGKLMLPYHPYTRAALQPVAPGQVTRYDVEVFPTFNTLEPGHSLRITVATSDFPHVLPSVAQLPNLLGGVYAVEHSSAYPSSVEIPLATPDAFTAPPNGPQRCPAARGRLHGRNLGAVKLGMTRARARRALTKHSTHGRRHMDFFCLSPTGIRVGYRKGRVVLVLTANRRYAVRGVHSNTRLSRKLARRLHAGKGFKVGRNTWYLVSNGPSRGVLKVQHGVIKEIGIASKRLTASRRGTAHFLRSFS
jgi:putative CocE/NonD family hydrolase